MRRQVGHEGTAPCCRPGLTPPVFLNLEMESRLRECCGTTPYDWAVPFTLSNIKEGLEDIGPRFDGAPNLEFRAVTKALELEKSALSTSVPPGYRFPYATRA